MLKFESLISTGLANRAGFYGAARQMEVPDNGLIE
jgi:hypothetical protein